VAAGKENISLSLEGPLVPIHRCSLITTGTTSKGTGIRV